MIHKSFYRLDAVCSLWLLGSLAGIILTVKDFDKTGELMGYLQATDCNLKNI